MELTVIKNTLTKVGSQIERVFQGLPTELQDALVTPKAMSPRLTLAHLTEVLEVIEMENRGEKPVWGKYIENKRSFEDLLEEYPTKRKAIIEATLEINSAEASERLMGFIALHESYHVGQLVLLRMEHEADYDPFSIYS